MDANKMISTLLNLVLLITGILLGLFLQVDTAPFSFSFSPILGGVVIAFGFFILSAAFFGMFSPALFFYFGLTNAGNIFSNPFGFILMALTVGMACSLGSTLGQAASRDLNGTADMSDYRKKIVMNLCITLLMGAVAGFVFGLNIHIPLPENFLPLPST